MSHAIGFATKRAGVPLALAGVGLVLAGCFDTSPIREPCTQGSIVGCTCPDRSRGTAACLAHGAVGVCRCEDGGGADVSPAGTGGTGTGGTSSGGAGGSGATGGAGVAPMDAGGLPDAGGTGIDAAIDGSNPILDASTPPTIEDLYKQCSTSADCGGGLSCAPIDTGTGSSGYCTQTCGTNADCTQPSSGTASATCATGQCLLQCPLGTTCPDGMACLIIPPLINNGFCHY